jgi:hypothetical protein
MGRGPIALAMGEPEEVPGSGVKGRPLSLPTGSEAVPSVPIDQPTPNEYDKALVAIAAEKEGHIPL